MMCPDVWGGKTFVSLGRRRNLLLGEINQGVQDVGGTESLLRQTCPPVCRRPVQAMSSGPSAGVGWEEEKVEVEDSRPCGGVFCSGHLVGSRGGSWS